MLSIFIHLIFIIGECLYVKPVNNLSRIIKFAPYLQIYVVFKSYDVKLRVMEEVQHYQIHTNKNTWNWVREKVRSQKRSLI